MAASGATWGLTDAERDLFLAEAEEFLGALEAGALEIEQGPADAELLHLMFRAAHTLKGNAGMAGLGVLAQRMHALEQQLDDLRAQRIAATPSVVQTMLFAVDDARRLLRDFAQGREAPVPPEAADPRPAPKNRRGRGAAASTGSADPSRPEAPAGNGTSLLLTVEVLQSSQMPAVRIFQAYQALGHVARVIDTAPAQEDLAQFAGRTAQMRVTGAGEDELRAAILGIPDVLLHVGPAAAGGAAPDIAQGTSFLGGADLSPVPAQSQMVRVRVDVLDHLMNLVGELVIDRARLQEIARRLESREADAGATAPELSRTTQHLGRVSRDLQESILRARMLPIDNLFRRLPRLVRDLAAQAGREVRLALSGENTELDRMVLDELADALTHLLRNAVDHGIEPPDVRERAGKPRQGVIRLSAATEEGNIVITLADDGRGIDPDVVRRTAVRKGIVTREDAAALDPHAAQELIFTPGFSTAAEVSEISGRGVGLDAVRASLEKVSGGIEITSQPGVGSTFRLRIPVTLAIMRALLVRSGGEVYGLPLGAVIHIVRQTAQNVLDVQDRPVLADRGAYIGVTSLRRMFDVPGEGQETFAVVLGVGQRRLALAVEELVGEQEIVLKPLGQLLGSVPGVIGCALLPSGEIALVADVRDLAPVEPRH